MIQYDLDHRWLAQEVTPESPPWKYSGINICEELYEYRKNRYTAIEMEYIFNEHLNSHNNSLQLYTDCSKTEEGVAFCYQIDENLHSSKIQSISSNFTAELYAIEEGINHVNQNSDSEMVVVLSDSKSAIQLIDKFNCKNPIVQKIMNTITISGKTYSFCWVPSHCDINGNEIADSGARNATRNEVIIEKPILRNDMKTRIKRNSMLRWNNKWRDTALNNKLRFIKDTTSPFALSNFTDRQWERVVCRLRIGHTALTHGYLMDGGVQPTCEHCGALLTVLHMLYFCPNLAPHRNYFGTMTYGELLTNHVQLNGILHNYLRTTGLLNLI